MQTTYTKSKSHRNSTRIWIEGQKLIAAGFDCDNRFDVDYNEAAKTIVLKIKPDGICKVASAKRNGKRRPIIDLTNQQVATVFPPGSRLRVTFTKNKITIKEHHETASKEDREKRFKTRSKTGKLVEASMFTGGGISTEAISLATQDAGLQSRVAWVCDMETKYIESAGENCLAIDDDTVFIVGAVEEIESELFTECDILSFSMPCAGFSKAGKSKHQTSAENHSGTALFGVINAIKSANPSIIISENVTEAFDSPIYQLLTSELRRCYYKVFEQVLNQEHTGTVENRQRYWLVAVSDGIAPDELALPEIDVCRPTISSLLEENPNESWCANEYMHAKAERDAAAGKGFKRQLLSGEEDRCGTIGRFYAKKRSTEPFLVKDKLERLFTPVEHARLKSVPEYLISNQSKTTAHEILGQSVDFLQPYNLVLKLFEMMQRRNHAFTI